MVALCSKTYYEFGSSTKISTNGFQKDRNKEAISDENFLVVMQQKQTSGGMNRGFRHVNNTMYTYAQQLDALSYLYITRKVCKDNLSTLPIDV